MRRVIVFAILLCLIAGAVPATQRKKEDFSKTVPKAGKWRGPSDYYTNPLLEDMVAPPGTIKWVQFGKDRRPGANSQKMPARGRKFQTDGYWHYVARYVRDIYCGNPAGGDWWVKIPTKPCPPAKPECPQAGIRPEGSKRYAEERECRSSSPIVIPMTGPAVNGPAARYDEGSISSSERTVATVSVEFEADCQTTTEPGPCEGSDPPPPPPTGAL